MPSGGAVDRTVWRTQSRVISGRALATMRYRLVAAWAQGPRRRVSARLRIAAHPPSSQAKRLARGDRSADQIHRKEIIDRANRLSRTARARSPVVCRATVEGERRCDASVRVGPEGSVRAARSLHARRAGEAGPSRRQLATHRRPEPPSEPCFQHARRGHRPPDPLATLLVACRESTAATLSTSTPTPRRELASATRAAWAATESTARSGTRRRLRRKAAC